MVVKSCVESECCIVAVVVFGCIVFCDELTLISHLHIFASYLLEVQEESPPVSVCCRITQKAVDVIFLV